MIRLYLVVFLVLILLSWAAPWLRRLGLGRLPGDLHFRLFGRQWDVPVTSTLLVGVVAGLVAKFV
ncbi:DUF2905 domain-containing protein [Xylophilus sp. ASV27]|uniref:DUF2905 domain-containing protein n=1 Tax=Xylophilus sp. ASV27 TaxID=2795129 RepID=UPI0018EBD9D6|nr:DUF2905 domain-containing protein [Xylophilus sp. ASV27]